MSANDLRIGPARWAGIDMHAGIEETLMLHCHPLFLEKHEEEIKDICAVVLSNAVAFAQTIIEQKALSAFILIATDGPHKISNERRED